jgi:hypothetical protein
LPQLAPRSQLTQPLPLLSTLLLATHASIKGENTEPGISQRVSSWDNNCGVTRRRRFQRYRPITANRETDGQKLAVEF